MNRLPEEERFWAKVEKSDDGCWLWQAARNGKSGYGMFQRGGRPQAAHRIAYELTIGPIPERAMVLHSCDVRACVRPDHLRIGSAKDNSADQLARGRRPKHYDPLLSLASAALELGLRPATLRQQIHNGRLAGVMLGGWHVRASEVERYRAESRRGVHPDRR